ncbi:iron transporter [Tsuneonella deserti]|uniref:Iron transporter n=1 Tax=Tsuneonella deserti TaxID=2035528 RepID=A0ABQ1S8C0_9SPHN|nr:NifU family protein [Tsuneonella deserti]GGD93773.1 iron transporter [Tsuneonella deserti]
MAFIEFEQTPNPDALRVQTGQVFTTGAALDFDRSSAAAPPLAADLLAIGGIERVMIGRDFVSVIRAGPTVPWDLLRPDIALVLMEHADAAAIQGPSRPDTHLGEVERHIEEVLDRYVRHLLAKDGGEATLIRFDAGDGTAWVRMGGACGGCPSGITTLKRTIEQTIMHWVPEVKRVHAEGTAPGSGEDPKARFRRWVQEKWGKSGR